MPVHVVAETTPKRRYTHESQQRPDRAAAAPVVFVVDDDVSTLALLRDVAEESGWAARGFTRLREFEAALRNRRPDLVIIDDDLPDGSGGDRARELGGDGSLEGVAVIVCTAAHPLRQTEIGAWAAVISKPFELREVERFLHRAADGRERMGGQGAG